MSYTEFSNQPEYSGHFGNAMRGRNEHYDKLNGGYDNYTSTYNLPDASDNKLAAFVKLGKDFVSDVAFGIEDYLTKRFAGNSANAEDKAFICGSGVDEPTGILNDGNGAEIGATASALTYDDVISLYFSIKPKYRKKAV